ncbi:MAG TPA: zf-HC2 domain-containing protein [Gemmatimonadaceae bacterium]|nr:zf-HC2 domain-containing protein [Gemmatimonadaceae bacterium]
MSEYRRMACEEVEERLSDWLEHDVDATTRTMLERHVADCARCTALVADLRSIRAQAASLPGLVPSRDLWPEIEAHIQAPVIALEQTGTRSVSRRAVLHRAWWLGAAAAGLVAVTAGVTYYLTSEPATQPVVVTAGPAVVQTPETTPLAQDSQPAATLASDTRVPATRREVRPVAGAPAPSEIAAGSEYARDVAELRAIVSQRRAEFDSTTIAVLEKNLELIDRAIAESRAALERDPASDFLADQLARAMTKKVAILRTVASLPARS